MSSTGRKALIALVQDALGAVGLPAGTMTFALNHLLRRRELIAHDTLMSEIARGNRTLADVDPEEAAAILYRYLRAAQEGAARLNLRLMAKVIAGQARLGNLVADEFLYYADVMGPLRYEEIVLLATLYRHTVVAGRWPHRESFAFDAAMTSAKAELVPSLFLTNDDFMSTAAAAMRTGLIIVGGEHSGLLYTVTPLMHRLQQMAPFEAAISEEQSERERTGNWTL